MFLLVLSCGQRHKPQSENWEYLSTDKLSDDVFVERFYVSHGVHAGGTQKYVVTDSSSYRFLIGYCDDKEYFSMELKEEVLLVEKHSRRNLRNGETKIIETKEYNLP